RSWSGESTAAARSRTAHRGGAGGADPRAGRIVIGARVELDRAQFVQLVGHRLADRRVVLELDGGEAALAQIEEGPVAAGGEEVAGEDDDRMPGIERLSILQEGDDEGVAVAAGVGVEAAEREEGVGLQTAG